MSAPDMQYALDTARAKTPAERLRIVADLMDAQERGERVYLVNDSTLGLSLVEPAHLRGYALTSQRFVTKRRPALVIPALELFELPAKYEELKAGESIWIACPWSESGAFESAFAGVHEIYVRSGVVFKTFAGASRVGLHIRNELAKAVSR